MNVCICIYIGSSFSLPSLFSSSFALPLSRLSLWYLLSPLLSTSVLLFIWTFHFDCLRPKSKSDYGQETNETNHKSSELFFPLFSTHRFRFLFPSHTAEKIMVIMTGTAALNLVVSHRSIDIVFFSSSLMTFSLMYVDDKKKKRRKKSREKEEREKEAKK